MPEQVSVILCRFRLLPRDARCAKDHHCQLPSVTEFFGCGLALLLAVAKCVGAQQTDPGAEMKCGDALSVVVLFGH